jgi:hypothetical protein
MGGIGSSAERGGTKTLDFKVQIEWNVEEEDCEEWVGLAATERVARGVI